MDITMSELTMTGRPPDLCCMQSTVILAQRGLMLAHRLVFLTPVAMPSSTPIAGLQLQIIVQTQRQQSHPPLRIPPVNFPMITTTSLGHTLSQLTLVTPHTGSVICSQPPQLWIEDLMILLTQLGSSQEPPDFLTHPNIPTMDRGFNKGCRHMSED